MDNERQIGNVSRSDRDGGALVEQTKAHFLREVLDQFKSGQARYDLNEEFTRTKRNRNFAVVGAVLLTCVVFIGFAFLLNNDYEKKNNTVQINSKEFDDINLRDLLDKAKKLDTDLSYAQLQLSIIEGERSAALSRLSSDSEDTMTMLRSKAPAADVLSKQTNQVQDRLSYRRAQINDTYDTKAKPIVESIAGLQTQIGGLDTRKLEAARQQELVLNNDRKLYDMERSRVQTDLENRIKSLTDEYEARLKQRTTFIKQLETSFSETLVREQTRLTNLYNPLWTDAESARLLSEPIDQDRLSRFRAIINQEFIDQGVVSQESKDAINQSLADYRGILSLFKTVPYTNSVPGALDQLKYRTLSLIDSTTKPYDSFWKIIETRNEQIAQLKTDLDKTKTAGAKDAEFRKTIVAGLEQYVNQNNLDGVVVDPADTDGVLVYVRPAGLFQDKKKVTIVRNGGSLGDYELKDESGLTHLSAVDPSKTPPAKPYDTVKRR